MYSKKYAKFLVKTGAIKKSDPNIPHGPVKRVYATPDTGENVSQTKDYSTGIVGSKVSYPVGTPGYNEQAGVETQQYIPEKGIVGSKASYPIDTPGYYQSASAGPNKYYVQLQPNVPYKGGAVHPAVKEIPATQYAYNVANNENQILPYVENLHMTPIKKVNTPNMFGGEFYSEAKNEYSSNSLSDVSVVRKFEPKAPGSPNMFGGEWYSEANFDVSADHARQVSNFRRSNNPAAKVFVGIGEAETAFARTVAIDIPVSTFILAKKGYEASKIPFPLMYVVARAEIANFVGNWPVTSANIRYDIMQNSGRVFGEVAGFLLAGKIYGEAISKGNKILYPDGTNPVISGDYVVVETSYPSDEPISSTQKIRTAYKISDTSKVQTLVIEKAEVKSNFISKTSDVEVNSRGVSYEIQKNPFSKNVKLKIVRMFETSESGVSYDQGITVQNLKVKETTLNYKIRPVQKFNSVSDAEAEVSNRLRNNFEKEFSKKLPGEKKSYEYSLDTKSKIEQLRSAGTSFDFGANKEVKISKNEAGRDMFSSRSMSTIDQNIEKAKKSNGIMESKIISAQETEIDIKKSDINPRGKIDASVITSKGKFSLMESNTRLRNLIEKPSNVETPEPKSVGMTQAEKIARQNNAELGAKRYGDNGAMPIKGFDKFDPFKNMGKSGGGMGNVATRFGKQQGPVSLVELEFVPSTPKIIGQAPRNVVLIDTFGRIKIPSLVYAQKLRSNQLQSQLQSQSLKLGQVQIQSQAQNQKQVQKQSQSLVQIQKMSQVQREEQIQKQAQIQKQGQTLKQSQNLFQQQEQVQEQIQLQQQEQAQVQKQIQIPKIVQIGIPKIVRVPPFKSATPSNAGSGFTLFVRRRGKFEPRGFFGSLKEAERQGVTAVSNSAAASFKIVGTGGSEELPGVSKEQFYKSRRESNVYVERRGMRIKSPGEKREITFKGILASRKRRSGFSLGGGLEL